MTPGGLARRRAAEAARLAFPTTAVPPAASAPSAESQRLAAIPMPARLRALAHDALGYPIPKFAETAGGKPDFRNTRSAFVQACARDRLCWCCGEKLGGQATFMIGPLAALTRMAPDPPLHLQCADYAMRVCPHLAPPVEQDEDLSEDILADEPQEGPARIICLWTVAQNGRDAASGTAPFALPEPISTSWFCNGGPATRAEIKGSFNAALPDLVAETKGDPAAIETLAEQLRRVMACLPHG